MCCDQQVTQKHFRCPQPHVILRKSRANQVSCWDAIGLEAIQSRDRDWFATPFFSTSECFGYYGDGKYVSAWRDWSMELRAAKAGHCFRRKTPWNKKIHRTGDEINGIGKSQHDLFSLCMCKPLLFLWIYMFCIYSLIVAKTIVFKYILWVLC